MKYLLILVVALSFMGCNGLNSRVGTCWTSKDGIGYAKVVGENDSTYSIRIDAIFSLVVNKPKSYVEELLKTDLVTVISCPSEK